MVRYRCWQSPPTSMEAKGKPGRMARRPSLCYGGSLITALGTWVAVGNAAGYVPSAPCWVRPRDAAILFIIVIEALANFTRLKFANRHIGTQHNRCINHLLELTILAYLLWLILYLAYIPSSSLPLQLVVIYERCCAKYRMIMRCLCLSCILYIITGRKLIFTEMLIYSRGTLIDHA